MTTTNTTFQQYLQSAYINVPWSTDEVIEFVLPLFEEVLSFHVIGLVGSFEKPDSVFLTDGRLDIDENLSHPPLVNFTALQKILDNQKILGYAITERVMVDEDYSKGTSTVTNLQVSENPNAELTTPVFLPGFQCYEMKLGHHDAQTDIFCLGLILASAVMGLDLYAKEDLNKFAAYRNQPAGINSRIHPTLSALVTEMTELNRNERCRDLEDVIQRLKHYRDYDPQRQTDLSKLAAFQVKKPADRRQFILSKLRNRLFDTSRRNRLLYYKPNTRFVNLTVSSVPMVLHYQSINPQLLFTWNDEISQQIISQNDISLNKYLRFEDHPYLNSQLNGIRQQAQNDQNEYGFKQLKLVVAFLHWHNLKEDAKERIQSPLLLLPVELERKKSLKEEKFTIKIIDNAAIINPILANHLKDLYGIELPESIDFDDVSMRDFFEMLETKINAAKQGVKINYIDKPRIKIIHNIARQTINNYKKRLKLRAATNFQHIDYSYSEENYKPLGLEIFRQKIEPRQSSLEFLLDETTHHAQPDYFAAPDNSTLKSTFHLTDGESNPYSWDFDICNIVLGNFNYKKMSLVSDYNKVSEEEIEHPVFNELFSQQPKAIEPVIKQNNPTDWYHVITADPTQANAVLQSRSGKSYIIQGPPGTGKSQTITNLIADFLANGKTVLFVCEKRAALDVVYHRLEQNKLSELCCYIHDSVGDKKDFYKDLKVIYEDFINNRMDLAGISSKRDLIIKQLLGNLALLQNYHQYQQNILPDAGISTRNLVETLIELKDHIPESDKVSMDTIPYYKDWLSYGNTIQQLGKALEESGAEQALGKHPFSNLGIPIIKADNPFALMDSLVESAYTSLQKITEVVSQNNIPAQHGAALENLKNLIQDSVVLTPLAESRNLKLIDANNSEAIEFEDLYKEYNSLQELYKNAIDSNKRWQHKFDKIEVDIAIEIASKNEKSFFSFLNSSWRKLKKELRQSYDFSSHKIKPAYSLILGQLKEEYKREESMVQYKNNLENKYNVTNIDTVYVGIEVLRRKQGDKEVDYLLQHPRSNELVLQLNKINNLLQQLEMQLKQCLYGYERKTIHQINDELATIKNNADALKELLPALRKFAELPQALQEFIRKLPLSPVQAEAAMANKTLELILEKNQTYAGVNQSLIADTVKDIEKNYNDLLQINADYIRSTRRQQFLQHMELSNTSVTVLNNEQRQFKKVYTDGRRVLEREIGKSMRYKSIREIASNESGIVLKDIKPVWLMSPLSVSDSLPLDQGFFDVVIYDEASQITLEEGIPALFRAPQTIIVGDEKQMPPSNFFMAKVEDPEDLEMIDGEQEDEILNADADSLLVQGTRKLNSTMLSWHYRSRYETLISYSNYAFYAAGLLTIPDKTILHYQKELTEINDPDEGFKNASLLLKGSISFHYLPKAVYEARSNIGEAKYIAQLIKSLLMNNISDTIGVVAFSQEQQGIIEEAIDSLAEQDKAFEELLEKAYNRKDQGQFTGLFVKNLENVQGDERDIIIMSVCYGHDSNKKMLMNFGPINRKGGEKRLNVIFSRAKKHMAIVSSIRHFHITNDYNDGANYFKRFLQYAELVSTGNMKAARMILEGLYSNEGIANTEKAELKITSDQIKKALELEGYIVDERIGQSNFKCTLAVKKQAGDAHYCLGILVDDNLHYNNNNLIEQYFQRPAILKAFGWQLITVFGKDWLYDKKRVLDRLLAILRNESNTISDLISEINDQNEINSIGISKDAANTVQLLSVNKEQFWMIEHKGIQLIIRFGKTGSTGQAHVKSFQTEEEANIVKEELVLQQKNEGYTVKE